MIVAKLGQMCGVRRDDRIKNKNVRCSINVASIVDKMREKILKRFKQMQDKENRGSSKKGYKNE